MDFGGGGPEQWFRRLPPVTRLLLGSSVVVTVLTNLGQLNWNQVCLHDWYDLTGNGSSGKVEAYRAFTCFLYAGQLKFGINTLIGLHLLTQISARYEAMGPICTRRVLVNPQDNQQQVQEDLRRRRSPYYDRGETSDYAWALLLGAAGIIVTNFSILPRLPTFMTRKQQYVFFFRHLTHFIVYIWTKKCPDQLVNLFGVNVRAAYLPLCYMIIGMALNNGEALPLDIIHGCFVGHLYYYLSVVVPQVLHGRVVIATPVALVDLCNWLEGRAHVADGRPGGGPELVDVDGVIGG